MTQQAQVVSPSPSAPSGEVIKSYEPVSGALLGEVPVMSTDEVHVATERARKAQRSWALLSVKERGQRLLAFRDALVERTEEVVDVLSRETGKPRHEALLHEVAVVADIITYLAKNASSFLAPEERSLHLFKQRRSIVTYMPRGVVGIIAPWNFPLQLAFRDIIPAVIAGNAVVVKPSEVTPLIMMKGKEIWDASGMPPDLLNVVTGYGATGAALIDSGIDLCVFTGSVNTGKRVAAACGERLIPCVMELGGKAPLIACRDCDIERTAHGIVNGGFANSGQVCISVERVYAHEDVYDRLVDRVTEITQSLTPGDPARDFCDIGGITFEHQIKVAEDHITDAVDKGAILKTGGKRRGGAVMGFEPTVIADCTQDCTAMTEEIFGPIVPIMRIGSEDQAVELANDSHLGLNAYVYTEDPKRGRALAERIEAGSVLVNEVMLNGGITETPFGGVKESGFGRVLGPEGLRTMCQVKHINMDRLKTPPKNPLGFPYSEGSYKWLTKGVKTLFSSGGLLKRLGDLF